jgi:hypothetical protein
MGERRVTYRVLVGQRERERPLQDLDTGVRIILKWILQKQDAGMDWIDVTHDRDKWWLFGFHKCANSLTTQETISFLRGPL